MLSWAQNQSPKNRAMFVIACGIRRMPLVIQWGIARMCHLRSARVEGGHDEAPDTRPGASVHTLCFWVSSERLRLSFPPGDSRRREASERGQLTHRSAVLHSSEHGVTETLIGVLAGAHRRADRRLVIVGDEAANLRSHGRNCSSHDDACAPGSWASQGTRQPGAQCAQHARGSIQGGRGGALPASRIAASSGALYGLSGCRHVPSALQARSIAPAPSLHAAFASAMPARVSSRRSISEPVIADSPSALTGSPPRCGR